MPDLTTGTQSRKEPSQLAAPSTRWSPGRVGCMMLSCHPGWAKCGPPLSANNKATSPKRQCLPLQGQVPCEPLLCSSQQNDHSQRPLPSHLPTGVGTGRTHPREATAWGVEVARLVEARLGAGPASWQHNGPVDRGADAQPGGSPLQARMRTLPGPQQPQAAGLCSAYLPQVRPAAQPDHWLQETRIWGRGDSQVLLYGLHLDHSRWVGRCPQVG